MNLKKTVLSLFAATAIVGSMFMPVAAEGDVIQNAPTSSSVNEDGDFSINLWFSSGVTFSAADISSPEGMTVTQNGDDHRAMFVSDTRTSSPGYTLQMTATDLKHEDFDNNGFYIDSDYLSVRNKNVGPHSSCLWGGATSTSDGAVVGGNAYQTHTWLLSNSYTLVGDGVELFSASEGRGCDFGRGGFQYNLAWQLALPGGIATGNYTGSMTISEVAPPSETLPEPGVDTSGD